MVSVNANGIDAPYARIAENGLPSAIRPPPRNASAIRARARTPPVAGDERRNERIAHVRGKMIARVRFARFARVC